MESPSPHRSSCSTGYATPDPQRPSSNEAQLFVGTRALTPLSSQPSHTTALVSLPSLQSAHAFMPRAPRHLFH